MTDLLIIVGIAVAAAVLLVYLGHKYGSASQQALINSLTTGLVARGAADINKLKTDITAVIDKHLGTTPTPTPPSPPNPPAAPPSV
jgi:Flp pilus assembly protein CpaB